MSPAWYKAQLRQSLEVAFTIFIGMPRNIFWGFSTCLVKCSFRGSSLLYWFFFFLFLFVERKGRMAFWASPTACYLWGSVSEKPNELSSRPSLRKISKVRNIYQVLWSILFCHWWNCVCPWLSETSHKSSLTVLDLVWELWILQVRALALCVTNELVNLFQVFA